MIKFNDVDNEHNLKKYINSFNLKFKIYYIIFLVILVLTIFIILLKQFI
jgi:hypothetical protein